MIPEIEGLILKRRKVIYDNLVKHKKIKPEGYFIIRTSTGVSEIMIPGTENYITTPKMKNLFADFIESKWKEYNRKMAMELLAVVLISDINYLYVKQLPGETVQEAQARSGPSPCNNPNSTDAIGFSVSMRDESKFYCYPYYRKGKNVTFGQQDTGMLDMRAEGRLVDIFPKHLKH